jgi:DNA-binding MarR family transcriptional regulator
MGEFILDMEKRATVGDYIELPMLRRDIADYLGLTIETVSRILTALEKYGAIKVLSHQGIVVCNHSLLKSVIGDQSKTSGFWYYLRKSTNKNGRRADRRTRIQDPPTGPRSGQQLLRWNGHAG